MNIPKIEYEVYYPLNGKNLTKLDLNKYEDILIDISLPVIIKEKNIDKYNSSSSFYNDICYKYESEKGIDISLNDRKNEYVNNDMNLCEENCDLKDYDTNNSKAICSCEIKKEMSSFSDININKTLLFNKFKDIKNIINLKIMKCFKVLFSINGIIKNIGYRVLYFNAYYNISFY